MRLTLNIATVVEKIANKINIITCENFKLLINIREIAPGNKK